MSLNPSFQLCLIVFSANLLALIGDSVLTWTSPVLIKLHSNDSLVNPLTSGPITQREESLIASLINFGPFLGAIPLGLLANKVGRKPVLLTVGALHIISFLTLAFSTKVIFFYFARILGGMATSSCYLVLPMYIAEIAENVNRGKLVVSYLFFSCFGSLLSYILGTYLNIMWMNLVLAGIGITYFILFGIFGIESAHYYIFKNDKSSAKKTLEKLRGNDEAKVKRECQEISAEIYKACNESGSVLKTFKRRHVIKAFVIAVFMVTLPQFSGVTAFMAYTEQIFAEADISLISASTSSIILATIQFVSVGISPCFIDKLGRKCLVISSMVAAILSEILLGIYFYIKENTDLNYHTISLLPIVCLATFFISFINGFGGISMVLYSELFPSNVKFFITSICFICSGVSGFLVVSCYPSVTASIGTAQTLWIFAASCTASMIFVVLYVPETKGKTFQEIQTILE